MVQLHHILLLICKPLDCGTRLAIKPINIVETVFSASFALGFITTDLNRDSAKGYFNKPITMKKTIALFCLLPLLAFGIGNLKKRKITDGVTMLLPESFVEMTEQEIKDAALTYRQPLVMYKDFKTVGNLALNVSATQWTNADIGILKDFYKSTILGIHSEVVFYQEETKQIGEHQFAIFEFASSVKPVRTMMEDKGAIKKYNYIQYTVVNGKVMIFSFSCPFAYRGQWQRTIKQMMDSVVVKK